MVMSERDVVQLYQEEFKKNQNVGFCFLGQAKNRIFVFNPFTSPCTATPSPFNKIQERDVSVASSLIVCRNKFCGFWF